MSSPKQDLIANLSLHYPNLQYTPDPIDENKISILVPKENLLELAGAMKDNYGFIHPIACGAVDYPNENKMQLIYYLMNPNSKLILLMRLNLDRGDPQTDSLTIIWEAISFHERETHEMFGIGFNGHQNLTPLLLPPDWKGGYPLKKDFKAEGVVSD